MRKLGFIILSTGLLVGGISFSASACAPGPDKYVPNANPTYYHVGQSIPNDRFYGPPQYPEWVQPGQPVHNYRPCDPGPGFLTQRPLPNPQLGRNVNPLPKFEKNDAPWNHHFLGAPGAQHPMGQPVGPVNQYNHPDWTPGFGH